MPPDGDITLVVELPAVGMPPASMTLDGAAIRAAAQHARRSQHPASDRAADRQVARRAEFERRREQEMQQALLRMHSRRPTAGDAGPTLREDHIRSLIDHAVRQLVAVDRLPEEIQDPEHIQVMPGRPHGEPGYYLRVIDRDRVVTMSATAHQMAELVEKIEQRVDRAVTSLGIPHPAPPVPAPEPLPEPPRPIAIHLPVAGIALNSQYADDVVLGFEAIPDESLPDLPAGRSFPSPKVLSLTLTLDAAADLARRITATPLPPRGT